jgi:transcriptional regulator with GAF, ATPase, and Fis domain
MKDMESTTNSEKDSDKRSLDKIKEKTSLEEFAKALIWKLAKDVEAVQGAFFRTSENEGTRRIIFTAGYAYHLPDSQVVSFEFGEGLSGQVAKSGNPISITKVPEGYIKVVSGLGESTPSSILIYPIKKDEKVIGVVELAGFKQFDQVVQNHIALTLEEVTPAFVALLNLE